MAMYIDMMDNLVDVVDRPLRVISLVPSLSLLLHDLGVGERLVGVTKFCVHPKELRAQCTIVGGTKLLHLDVINDLKPDLIIANKEENNQADVEILQATYPVWVSDVNTVQDALSTIRILGQIVDCRAQAEEIHKEIEHQRLQFKQTSPTTNTRIAYLIWNNPLMVAGRDTFIDEMVTEAGWLNAFDKQGRYPACTIDGLNAQQPDWLFLSSEPFPFKEKHKSLFSDIIPPERILIVDGEMFSWYGSRLRDSYTYFTSLHNVMKTPVK